MTSLYVFKRQQGEAFSSCASACESALFNISKRHDDDNAGHGGLVVGCPTAVQEDPGSNLTAAGRVYHDSHCDIQPWARVVHPYCTA